MDKKKARLRRARRTRAAIRRQRVHRLSVNRSPRHIYAQVFEADGSRVLASASTLDKEVRERVDGSSGNVSAAAVVGQAIAERARQAGIARVAFDRSGYKYHGRVKALAEAAREHGLEF
jgi:large subunit ribosomal protein L18